MRKTKILIIDNYDSFIYSLLHQIEDVTEGKSDITVKYNDEISVEEASLYDYIVISPGPGVPSEAGNIVDVINRLSPRIPMLGVCLGHQAIAQAFGGDVARLKAPVHGIKSPIKVLDHKGVFKGLDDVVSVGRYHSWVVKDLPETLSVTAVDDEGNVMAISHKNYNVHGVQFHPESIMTPCGYAIMKNFLTL